MDLIEHRIEILQLKIRYNKNVLFRLNYLHSLMKTQKESQAVFLKNNLIPDMSAVNRQMIEIRERIHEREESLAKLEYELQTLKATSSSGSDGSIS
jgi:hypothetical protein